MARTHVNLVVVD